MSSAKGAAADVVDDEEEVAMGYNGLKHTRLGLPKTGRRKIALSFLFYDVVLSASCQISIIFTL